jgi:deferrochelatase/peroxidase EfeB
MKVENNRERAQNHLASVSRLKGGLLRRLTLRLAFVVVGTGRFVCAPGFLGKNGVIHFARWMRLPGTDQLLFWSNYDGTWESYVADFIADAPTGVTAIWSNCFGFPRSSALFGRGATDRDRLVRWARRQQHPTTFWYSAYPYLTADRIRINAAIRQGLASAESDADARDWLDLFGSKTRPPDALQVSQVPTLVFGGLPRLRHATCLAIQFDSRSTLPERRHWLATAARHASYGEMLPGQQAAVVVAFSATGLKALGLDEDTIATFPVPFQEGMWPEWRARALGDFDDNAPKYWDWGDGNRREQVDVLVLVYARGPEELTNQTTQVKPPNGIARVLRAIPLKLDIPAGARYPEELFGFADGVSQPVIAGTPRSRTRTSPNDLVAPGEIVLGYPDNLSRSLNLNVIPPSPSVSGRDDPEHMLQDVGPDPFRRRPEFSRYEGTGRRDLGANGTFLVVRQLEQDKKALDQWLEEAVDSIKHEVIVATEGSGDGKGRTAVLWGNRDLEKETQGPLARTRLLACQQIDWTDQDLRKKIKNYISAKLVGRWQDGTSLVRHPLLPGSEDSPPAHPDNAFLLGAEDPTGLACPFGAHIRRANPRDTRFPGSSEEIATTNRHRILRVGRTYRMPDQAAAGAGGQSGAGNTKEGLLFMCLNADIERQFEFVQKTWIMNPNLHGLENEDDPLLGRGSTTFTVPTPTGSVVLKGLGKFVTMKGGGYFFIPGRAVLRYLMR